MEAVCAFKHLVFYCLIALVVSHEDKSCILRSNLGCAFKALNDNNVRLDFLGIELSH